jgi:hypothetical protein
MEDLLNRINGLNVLAAEKSVKILEDYIEGALLTWVFTKML